MTNLTMQSRDKIGKAGIARGHALARVEALRAQAGRFFLLAILRTHCAPAKRDQYARLHAVPAAFVREGLEILLGHGKVPSLDRDAVFWIRDTAQGNHSLCDQGKVLLGMIEDLESQIETSPESVIATILSITAPLTAFMQLLEGEVIEPLRAELSENRNRRLSETQQAAEAARTAMIEISQISRSVRLISLNASVEAARVGDQGRGFAVIAGEIKALAESIDLVTQTATNSMTELMGAVVSE